MPKRPKVKELEIKAFAHAYVDSGHNGTQAMQVVRPHLDDASASVAASRMLDDDMTVSAIMSITDQCKDTVMSALQEACAIAQTELRHENPAVRQDARNYLKEIGKIFAPANSMPRTAIQNNKYVIPKR